MLLPIRRPFSRAANEVTWGAGQRGVNNSRPPQNADGSGRPMKVAKARRKMRSASFSSASLSGPTVMGIDSFIRCDLLGSVGLCAIGGARAILADRGRGSEAREQAVKNVSGHLQPENSLCGARSGSVGDLARLLLRFLTAF